MNADLRTRKLEGRRIDILANPKAGAKSGKQQVAHLQSLLEDAEYQTRIYWDIEEFRAHVATAEFIDGLRCVVAAGGDGTVALAVNLTPAQTPIAVLPLGTENLLSKYLTIAKRATAVFDTIDTGTTVALDAGLANGRLFLLMAGCGFDADVVQRVHAARTGHIHHFSYAKPIWDSIRKYDYPELRVCYRDDVGEEQQISARWAFVANLPRYAGGLRLVNDACGSDGLLDVCTFRQGHFWPGVYYLAGVLTGQHRRYNDVKIVRTNRFRIEADGEVPFQLDGDPGGVLPVEFEVLPEHLTIVAPQKWVARQTARNTRAS